jgi:hypothetical protein
VVLDACRDNPFSWSRSGSRGLIVVRSQPADSIIVYATSAGSTASDTSVSGLGRNGLFTGHLLKHLKTPGLEVNEVFRLTGGDVARASGGGQRPAVYNQFYGVAYLGAKPDAQTSARPAPAVGAENLSGTRWTLNYHDFTKGETSSTIEFLAGGVFTDSDPDDKTRGNDFWEQNGTTVLLLFNNHFITFRGAFVTNDRIEGTIGTNTMAFTLTRIQDNTAKAYKPGDTGPAGGWVFYDKGSYSDGWRYLEAAPHDVGEASWGGGIDAAGTETAVGSGRRNTQLIPEALQRAGETGKAAQLCADFAAEGFKDWFLPSKDELDLMYKNLKSKGLGSFKQSQYWASSEENPSYAWFQRFSDGFQDYSLKFNTGLVRAVRAF